MPESLFGNENIYIETQNVVTSSNLPSKSVETFVIEILKVQ